MFNQKKYIAFVASLTFLLLINISYAQMNISDICENTGGSWISKKICPPSEIEMPELCSIIERCDCPEGYAVYCTSNGCIKDLDYGTQPTSKEICENGDGKWVEGINENATTSAETEVEKEQELIRDSLTIGNICYCTSGEYWSAEQKCVDIPERFLCESTCGIYEDDSCICESGYVWKDSYGCLSIMSKQMAESEKSTISQKINELIQACANKPETEKISTEMITHVLMIAIGCIILIVFVTVIINNYILKKKTKHKIN